MTAASKSIYNRIVPEGTVRIPVKAAKTIYKGTIVCVDATGYALPGADTAGLIFMGLALEDCDNSAGSSGDKDVLIVTSGLITMSYTGAITQADMGSNCTISDDNNVADAGATTNDIVVGKLIRFTENNKVVIKI